MNKTLSFPVLQGVDLKSCLSDLTSCLIDLTSSLSDLTSCLSDFTSALSVGSMLVVWRLFEARKVREWEPGPSLFSEV